MAGSLFCSETLQPDRNTEGIDYKTSNVGSLKTQLQQATEKPDKTRVERKREMPIPGVIFRIVVPVLLVSFGLAAEALASTSWTGTASTA